VADSAAIEAAVIAKLNGDATLLTTATDGAYFGVTPNGVTAAVVVTRQASEVPRVFGSIGWEKVLLLVKAVMRTTDPASARTAAARIDVLLDDVALSITGYRHMRTLRVESVRYAEIDDDTDEQWQHAGARYEIWATPTS
jgi:hypothetical protein